MSAHNCFLQQGEMYSKLRQKTWFIEAVFILWIQLGYLNPVVVPLSFYPILK